MKETKPTKTQLETIKAIASGEWEQNFPFGNGIVPVYCLAQQTDEDGDFSIAKLHFIDYKAIIEVTTFLPLDEECDFVTKSSWCSISGSGGGGVVLGTVEMHLSLILAAREPMDGPTGMPSSIAEVMETYKDVIYLESI